MLTHLKATTKELFSQPSLKGTRAECVTQKEICGSCSSRRRPRVRDCGFLVETAAIANRSPGRARMGGKNAPRPPSTHFLTSHSYFPLAQPKSKKGREQTRRAPLPGGQRGQEGWKVSLEEQTDDSYQREAALLGSAGEPPGIWRLQGLDLRQELDAKHGQSCCQFRCHHILSLCTESPGRSPPGNDPEAG